MYPWFVIVFRSRKILEVFVSQIIFRLKIFFESSNIFKIEQVKEKMFKVKTIPACPAKVLQSYQADEALEIDITGRFEVKTKDKTFTTCIYPFLQTDHLVNQLMGKATHFYTYSSASVTSNVLF